MYSFYITYNEIPLIKPGLSAYCPCKRTILQNLSCGVIKKRLAQRSVVDLLYSSKTEMTVQNYSHINYYNEKKTFPQLAAA